VTFWRFLTGDKSRSLRHNEIMSTEVLERGSETTSDELLRLYRAYRTAWLNKTYYAILANRARWMIASLQVVAAIASSGAFYVLKQQGIYADRAMWFALVAAACSFIVTFLGLVRDQSDYRSASASNAEIHSELKNLITQIVRSGEATDEQMWLSKYLIAKEVGYESKDVGSPRGRLTRRLTKQMNRIFPTDETAWDQF
jgi:hypothetical protein